MIKAAPAQREVLDEARASGLPNDVMATPAKAQALTGRAPDVRGGRSAVVPVVRAGKVVTGEVSSRRQCSSWRTRTRTRTRCRPR
jgi:uncharacterized protein (DUF3084 family)